MIPEAVLEETFRLFPQLDRHQLSVEPLEKGGSGRKYYRLAAPCAASVILVTYTGQREENRHFCEIAQFLHGLGLHVPVIHQHDAANGIIWVEDLGAIDLWHYRDSEWEARRSFYRSALDQVAQLHVKGHRAECKSGSPTFQKAFDAELYRWEQDYFFENCAGRHFGFSESDLEAQFGRASRRELQGIAERLAAEPRVLVHRDFQSQNVMIRDNGSGVLEAALIDFQGMRPGLGQYDLASLLYDPYVPFTENERTQLVGDYQELLLEAGGEVSPHFDEIYRLCAVQRLMQALGAYGFLGHTQGKPEFLAHIAPALERLLPVAQQIEGLEGLSNLLKVLKEREENS